MNMVMQHEFQKDFNQKMTDKMLINLELEKIAKMTQKNYKHNIPMTNAQAIRMSFTKKELMKKEEESAENAYYQAKAMPKMYGTSPGQ